MSFLLINLHNKIKVFTTNKFPDCQIFGCQGNSSLVYVHAACPCRLAPHAYVFAFVIVFEFVRLLPRHLAACSREYKNDATGLQLYIS